MSITLQPIRFSATQAQRIQQREALLKKLMKQPAWGYTMPRAENGQISEQWLRQLTTPKLQELDTFMGAPESTKQMGFYDALTGTLFYNHAHPEVKNGIYERD
jgi:hypothetical protein